MTFDDMLEQAIDMLRRRGRVSYRALKRQFDLDETYLEDLKAEIVQVHQLAVDQDGEMLVWIGNPESVAPISAPVQTAAPAPLVYTPKHLTEKILASRAALAGERKQVTVLFADLKGSLELLADRDPEEARQILDPVLARMMEAIHRYEGTVNQVMGDGVMALFGAPLAHEDHAVRACYAALRMQETVHRWGEEMQRAHGIPVQIRVGLHSGEVVVRSIDSDLHMDYSAIGQTTHLAARMEQMARPGSVLATGETLRLAEGYVQVKALGPSADQGAAGSDRGLRDRRGWRPALTFASCRSTWPDALCRPRRRDRTATTGAPPRRRRVMARRSVSSVRPGWANRVCSSSSCAHTAHRTGCCLTVMPCRMVRPHRICP